jgi:NADH dehydrogenase
MMRVAVLGGTGFVGSYLIDALIEAGMQPVVLVRPGHEDRLRHAQACRLVSGDIGNLGAVTSVLSEADAVIYNIGILREQPSRGATFEELHYKAPRRVMDAAEQLGVKRFLLMSANGVDAGEAGYQTTKLSAERHLLQTGLDWTVFRPSVIFGDPRGRMEFASQLRRDIIDSPLPAPLIYTGIFPQQAGGFRLSPVHVEDVAAAFVSALGDRQTVGEILYLGGPASISWRQILETIAAATGRQKHTIPVPALGLSTAAALFDRFEAFPITRDQIQMLMQGNTCEPADLLRLGIEPRPFDRSSLAYLNAETDTGVPWHRNAA